MWFIAAWIVLFILIVIFLHKPKEGFTTLADDDIIVVTYENASIQNTQTHNLDFLLKYLGYKHVHYCGQNEIWQSWKGRLESYRSYLKSLNRNYYVLLCDGRDVLANSTYSLFKEKAVALYNSSGKRIIFSAEKNCCTGHLNEEPTKRLHMRGMMEYMAGSRTTIETDHYYLNFGLAFGKANDFLQLFAMMQNKHNVAFDDQAEAAVLFQKYKVITLDYDEVIFANISGNEICDLKVNNMSCLLRNNNFGTYPCFMHFPGKSECYYEACRQITRLLKMWPKQQQPQTITRR